MSETKRIKTALVSVVNLLSLWVIPVKQWKTLLHTLPFWVDV